MRASLSPDARPNRALRQRQLRPTALSDAQSNALIDLQKPQKMGLFTKRSVAFWFADGVQIKLVISLPLSKKTFGKPSEEVLRPLGSPKSSAFAEACHRDWQKQPNTAQVLPAAQPSFFMDLAPRVHLLLELDTGLNWLPTVGNNQPWFKLLLNIPMVFLFHSFGG